MNRLKTLKKKRGKASAWEDWQDRNVPAQGAPSFLTDQQSLFWCFTGGLNPLLLSLIVSKLLVILSPLDIHNPFMPYLFFCTCIGIQTHQYKQAHVFLHIYWSSICKDSSCSAKRGHTVSLSVLQIRTFETIHIKSICTSG